MKTIVIYGGAGFIGTCAVNFFVKKNFNVIVLDKLTYAGNKSNLSNLIKQKKIKFIKGDIVNHSLLIKINTTYNPDYILNFAAESHVDRSITGADDFFASNTLGVYKILESLKYYKSNCKKKFKFIHISTDEVFGSIKKGSFKENSAYNPSSPYSATKAASDNLVKGWCTTYNINYNITNCTNNYGPYQYPEKMIPLTIFRSLNMLPILIYGDGKNVRDWIYVEDHIKYVYEIMKKGNLNTTYNISTQNELSNNNLVKKIIKNLDKFKKLGRIKFFSNEVNYVTDRPAHDFRYSVNISKIKKIKPKVKLNTFEINLYNTIDWYISNKKWLNETLARSNYKGDRLGLKW